jgi:lysophospholipase L1-like esterase
MLKLIMRFLLISAFTGITLLSCSQDNKMPFGEEIQAFKKTDHERFPPKNAILFVGSSSFKLWNNIESYFPGYTVFNRGFGGSSLPDVIQYSNEIIVPYQPKQIIIYCGENDIASSDSVSAAVVLQRFTQLFESIRQHLPGVSIVFVSIKPSPSRSHLMPVMEEANLKIKEFLSKDPNTAFVDVYHLMLDKEGKPRKELFGPDNLHMKPEGYKIWQKAITPFLLK